MYRKEVNQSSPLRILEKSIHGGLGPGNLGVVMARAGVGKTACLVQIGLDDAMRSQNVLHIALGGQTVSDVRRWYDALFADMALATSLEDRDATRLLVDAHRIIQAFGSPVITAEQLEHAVDLFAVHAEFVPAVILVDGYDWEHEASAESLSALKACAQRHNAELWMTARTHREETGPHPEQVPPPCADHKDLLDVVLLLEPQKDHVTIRLLKDHDYPDHDDMHLELQPDTMRLVVVGQGGGASGLIASRCTLLSGGARGSEATFGECAARWGLQEIHFTFEGRVEAPARTRGLKRLTPQELHRGAVSSRYVLAHLHRRFQNMPDAQPLLQSIWHQVNTARQVFVVGKVQADGTVRGGTGWAAELSKHLEKPVHVFDQERARWFTWNGETWAEELPPTITTRRFAGTGTRALNDNGRRAIEGLFERSFGAR